MGSRTIIGWSDKIVFLNSYIYRVLKLVNDLEAANKAKEDLRQQIQTLEQQIQILNEEKKDLLLHNQALQQKDVRNPLENARKQIELLKEELFKAEVIRDDFKAKLLEQVTSVNCFSKLIVLFNLTL